ncbi:MAG TPA: hypothetical protein H9871_01315 [Candidatus Nesterenkonia stercoripullorum]|uniref:Uncharacterized protein n=1 Tax=Candidatus Nesterenkonia stercoripullorum TaxID=2838701 RepID=A0A9D1RYY2_9MICC|nr:hypothetical protein [Candidatus Nesterenkonia stercoripullorum]
MSKDYMYRARIIESPEFEEYEAFDDKGLYGESPGRRWVTWHRPVGWRASEDYIDHYGTNKFFEPRTERWYKSRSSAADRVKLLGSMGYRAIVQRSAPVVWPRGHASKVDVSESAAVVDAIRTLVRAGVVKSADDLL